LQGRVPPLPRARASLARDRLHRSRRVELGCPSLPAAAARPRLHPLDERTAGDLARAVSLARTLAPTRGLAQLGLLRAPPAGLRRLLVPRPSRLRFPLPPLRPPPGRLRPPALPGPLRLRVRQRLAPGELLPRPPPHRRLLLRLLPLRPHARRLHAPA